jgi:hypothetical protein
MWLVFINSVWTKIKGTTSRLGCKEQGYLSFSFPFCWLNTDGNKALGKKIATNGQISDLRYHMEERSPLTRNCNLDT